MERKGYIGASDVSIILGESPWKTPKQLWLEKTGQIEPEDLSNNHAVQQGIEMESLAFPKVKSITGIDFEDLNDRQFSVPGHDFIKARPDGQAIDMLLEIKTVSEQVIREYHKNGVPSNYGIQMQTQMLACGVNKCLFFAQSRDGNNIFIDTVEEDKFLTSQILDKCSFFWKAVQENKWTEPDPVEKTYLNGEIEKDTDDNLTEKISKIERLTEIIKVYKEEEKKIKIAEKELKDLLKDVDGYRSSKFKIDWMVRKTSSLDKRELEDYLKKNNTSLKTFQITSKSSPFIKIKRNEKTNKKFTP